MESVSDSKSLFVAFSALFYKSFSNGLAVHDLMDEGIILGVLIIEKPPIEFS